MITFPEATTTTASDDRSSLTTILDRIETRLPAIPRAWLKLNRTVARTSCAAVSTLTHEISRRSRSVAAVADVSRRTVAGQASAQSEAIRSQLGDLVDTAECGTKTVLGQTRAEAAQAREAATTAVVELLEEASDQIEQVENDIAETNDLREMSRADLYALAQKRDIDGRSGMKKAELVTALEDVMC